MKIRLLLSPFIIILLLSSLSVHASIILVTNTANPLQNIPDGARVINLDESIELYQRLSDNLPNDPQRAEQLVRSRLTTLGSAYQQNIQRALQDALDAYQLGIKKIPAVIQDNRYVVYGESDVSVALQLIEQGGSYEP